MTFDQITLSFLLLSALVFFIIGRPRYDIVSLALLIIATLLGIVPLDKTFLGFSHAAVITVIAIFVISAAIENTGLLNILSHHLKLRRKVIWKQILLITGLVAALSGMINNVGAVALLIPVTLNIARLKNIPRSFLLMPLAFGSLLGGLITLIGTPPNIIISDFRNTYTGEPFAFFDYTPVGLGVAIVGVLFIALAGWRLIPLAKEEEEEIKYEDFTVELNVKGSSSLIGKKVAKLIHFNQERMKLFALIRENEIYTQNLEHYTVKTGDSFVIETDKYFLRDLIDEFQLIFVEKGEASKDKDYFLLELALLPASELVEKNVGDLSTLDDYGFEIIAVSRRGETLSTRLEEIILMPGDLLLIKSPTKLSHEIAETIDCLLMEEKVIKQFSKRLAVRVFFIFALSLFAVIFKLLPADVAFMSAALLMLLTGCLSLEKGYRSINWPVVVLVGTLIPVGQAMETTGTAQLIGQLMYQTGKTFPIWLNLYALVLTCMLLSNLINNAAVALVFAPIAFQLSHDWGASLDPFLMAVAVGASCTFMTPIGHQSNALVLGPGRYRFKDFFYLGLPLTLLVSIAATILILFVWPLSA